MRKLIVVLVALLALGVAPKITYRSSALATATLPLPEFKLSLIPAAEAAPRGNPYCRMAGTPKRLASLIQASLEKDHSGNTPLDPVACHEARPATPREIYETLRKSEAPIVSLAQTPDYVRSLVPVTVHGRYRSACLAYRFGAHGKIEWYPLVNCVTRHLHHAEVMWGDPVSHKPMLQSDCANPVQGPARESGCVDVLIPVEKGDEVRIHNTGPTDIAQYACTGLLRAGETEWESPFVEHCPDPECTFSFEDELTDAPSWGIGSWVAQKNGYAIVREPALVATQSSGDYRLWICVRRADGTQSCGLGVRWQDYTRRDDAQVARWFRIEDVKHARIPSADRMLAVIYSDKASFMAAGSPLTRLGTVSELWLNWNCPW